MHTELGSQLRKVLWKGPEGTVVLGGRTDRAGSIEKEGRRDQPYRRVWWKKRGQEEVWPTRVVWAGGSGSRELQYLSPRQVLALAVFTPGCVTYSHIHRQP